MHKMINSISKPFSSQIQIQYNHPSNIHKNSLIPSKSYYFPFNSSNSCFINTSVSIKTTLNSLPKATTGFYTTSPEEETLYGLLGISESGTLSEIKRAYKQMALKYHPDVSPPERADEYTIRFIQVQKAYETLSDPESRAMYDCCMAKVLHLAFSKNGSRFQPGSDEKGQWKTTWEIQVAELKQRSEVVEGGRMSWAARLRKQRHENESGTEE